MAVALSALAVGVVGCTPQTDPDCIVKVLYRDHVYRATGSISIPRAHRSLGSATFAGCDAEPLAGDSYTGHLLALPGVDPDEALLLHGEGFRSLYVRQDLPRRRWPELLKEANRHPRCRHPVRFTGGWVRADGVPQAGHWHAAVPYAGYFKARRGHGLNFQRWSSIALVVRITPHTQPTPSPPLLKRAIDANAPVTVEAACDGNRFVATSVRLAGGTAGEPE
ncbi:MAG TPA: hypothetical protein VFJ12_05145 [Segeticoccus sp.]|nr:hypothetical protein [Segeticoccus sp.]